MASATGQWDFSRMSLLLSESILYRISAIRPPHPSLGNDAPSWRWTDSQTFSSKMAYDRIAREAKSEKLLTNKERVHRHLTASPCCSICFASEESVLHVLRDCSVAGNTWRRLVQPSKLIEFMALPFDEWLMSNLCGCGGSLFDVTGWGVLFPTICWILWKNRCKQVMEPDSGVDSDPFIIGHQLATAYVASTAASVIVGRDSVPGRRWCKPRVGEQNKVADALAALGRNGPIDVAIYEHPPVSINRLLVHDSCDMTTTCDGG
ncbi:hypothetical protein V6N12_028832 [Hibiscus sabdariffa]|uniref:Reverse transcriptase zinc-binding domain-containing protein n=1 Tax=Hibiscus sabdariffa TaxID=183260 RepID=A0ABR2F711_9ROSI